MPSVGELTNLRKWLYQKKCTLKKGEKGKETHLLLDGGRAIVPPELNEEFLRVYARSLFEGDWVYVVEMKTNPVFYMMCEFDIKLRDREVTPEEISRMVEVIQREVFAHAIRDTDTTLVVSTAPSKPSTLANGESCVQSGIHFNWRVPVDGETAWKLRAWMLHALSRYMPEFRMAVDWQEAFDSAVFGKNGLRMIGARKAMPCPTCNGKSFKPPTPAEADAWGEVCAGCHNSGKVDMGRPYRLFRVADYSGAEIPGLAAQFAVDPLCLVHATTIRYLGPVTAAAELSFPSDDIYQLVTSNAEKDVKAKRNAGRRKVPAKDGAVVREIKDKARDREETLTDVMPEDDVFKAISEYVRGEFTGLPSATRIKKSGSGGVYIVTTNCTYCSNKGGNHAHSTVYFVMTPKGCVQRCFCPKDAQQSEGRVKCSEYTSRAHKIPPELLSEIFKPSMLRARQKEEARMKFTDYMAGTGGGPSPPPASPDPVARAAGGGNGVRAVPYVAYRKKGAYTPEELLQAVKNANYKIV